MLNLFKQIRQAFTKKSADSKEISLNELMEAFGLHGVKKGALSEATYFACLKVLSESIGKLPLKIQQRTPNKGIRIAREHPYYRMLHVRPNRYMTACAFWSCMELFRGHYGNAYAWIDTRNRGAPQLWIMHPKDVQVWYDDTCVLRDVPDVYYRYSTPKGVIILGSEEVLHIRSHNTYNGLVGISVQEQLADTIASNLKAQKVLNKLYDSGMTAKAVLNYTGELNEKNVNTLIAQFKAYLEAFSPEALHQLAELFTGKTVIKDHNPTADNQIARIYRTEVADNGGVMQLLAHCYMVKTAGNADLIAEIKGGIKKEGSVSCSIGARTCSICGTDLTKTGCRHIIGKRYAGKTCCSVLSDAKDAYEFSLVAVPAQKSAGVSKSFEEDTNLFQLRARLITAGTGIYKED